jgi:hypothetical protein
MMASIDSVVAVFSDHEAAEAAVKKLAGAGFEMKNLTVVGKGYHTDEKVVGFYNAGDRVKFWGSRGAFWGGFWGLFFGGIFLTIPVVGHVVVLGYLTAMVVSAVESAVLVGGLSGRRLPGDGAWLGRGDGARQDDPRRVQRQERRDAFGLDSCSAGFQRRPGRWMSRRVA